MKTSRLAQRRDQGRRSAGRGNRGPHRLGDRAGQAAQGWPDAPLLGNVRPARREHHPRHRAVHRREGRQARRPRAADHQARRRIQARERAAERRPPRQARSGGRPDRYGAFGRADGHPQGGGGKRHADHRAERRQRGGDARPVRQERVPLVLHQLAAGLRHGRCRGQEGLQEGRLGDVGLCRRRGERRGLQGRLREGRRRRCCRI